jgi:tRNA modification GTPase
MYEEAAANPAAASPANETFVSRLTAAGKGAIAVIRVWGPRACQIADAAFTPTRGKRLAETPPGTLRLGRVGRGLGDEVVAVIMGSDPPAVEIQCHGGEAAVALVIEALVDAGALVTEHGVAGANLVGDPIADLALQDLALTQTVSAAEILLEQSQGALRDGLLALKDQIATDPAIAEKTIDILIQRGEFGLQLVRGWRVAIVGRPNVGKSSLFNALVGFGRAIVDRAPGTTRDVVTHAIAIDGWPVELADTAGVRDAIDMVERIGVERSFVEQRQADLVLLVLDQSAPWEPADIELVATSPRAILVGNKSDLPSMWSDRYRGQEPSIISTVSAATGEGLARLIAAIACRLVPDRPPPGAAVPFRADQVDGLRLIQSALGSLEYATATDLVARLLSGRQP